MTLVLIGLNHRTAPVALREQLALSGCRLTTALTDIRDNAAGLHEGVVLSTCNRLEIYAIADDARSGWQHIEQVIYRIHGLDVHDFTQHLYYLADNAAVQHLLRVASGLDSMILGEPQILGQVNQAYQSAQVLQSVGPLLSRLFMQAIHCGKRARSETGISQHTTSVSHAAAQLIEQTVGDLSTHRILIVGAGAMAEQAADALSKRGATQLFYVNRTFASAETLALQYGGEAVGWSHLHKMLRTCDAVVAATGAPHTILHTADVLETMEARQYAPLLLMDIAVPRDVESTVGDLPNVMLHDIDALQHTVDANIAQRQAAAAQVEVIIAEEQQEYAAWLCSREVAPVISDLHKKAQDIARGELEYAMRRLEAAGDYEKKIVEKMAHRIVNKLLYAPTARLREEATHGHVEAYLALVRELFQLDQQRDGLPSYASGD